MVCVCVCVCVCACVRVCVVCVFVCVYVCARAKMTSQREFLKASITIYQLCDTVPLCSMLISRLLIQFYSNQDSPKAL